DVDRRVTGSSRRCESSDRELARGWRGVSDVGPCDLVCGGPTRIPAETIPRPIERPHPVDLGGVRGGPSGQYIPIEPDDAGHLATLQGGHAVCVRPRPRRVSTHDGRGTVALPRARGDVARMARTVCLGPGCQDVA